MMISSVTTRAMISSRSLATSALFLLNSACITSTTITSASSSSSSALAFAHHGRRHHKHSSLPLSPSIIGSTYTPLIHSTQQRRRHFSSNIITAAATTNGNDNGITITTINGTDSQQLNPSTLFSAAAAIGIGMATASTTSSSSLCSDDDSDTPLVFPPESLETDHYNGITVKVAELPRSITDCPTIFEQVLRTALEEWKREGKRGIWLRIPTELSHLVAPGTCLGFDFQHAQAGHVILTRWLPTDVESRLPLGPTHQIGIGAIVVHPLTKEILVVQERSGPAAARRLWKMPTGLANPNEDIPHAAIREIKEETNLDCTFDSILCFRQSHPTDNNKIFRSSDLFFVCLLRLSPEDEETLLTTGGVLRHLIPQEEEIREVKWMSVSEYAEQEVWRGSPLYGMMNEVVRGAVEGMGSGGFEGRDLPIGWRPGSNMIYVDKKSCM